MVHVSFLCKFAIIRFDGSARVLAAAATTQPPVGQLSLVCTRVFERCQSAPGFIAMA